MGKRNKLIDSYIKRYPEKTTKEIAAVWGISYGAAYHYKKTVNHLHNGGKDRPYTDETAYLIRRWVAQGDSIEKIMAVLGRSRKSVEAAFNPEWDRQTAICIRKKSKGRWVK